MIASPGLASLQLEGLSPWSYNLAQFTWKMKTTPLPLASLNFNDETVASFNLRADSSLILEGGGTLHFILSKMVTFSSIVYI